MPKSITDTFIFTYYVLNGTVYHKNIRKVKIQNTHAVTESVCDWQTDAVVVEFDLVLIIRININTREIKRVLTNNASLSKFTSFYLVKVEFLCWLTRRSAPVRLIFSLMPDSGNVKTLQTIKQRHPQDSGGITARKLTEQILHNNDFLFIFLKYHIYHFIITKKYIK